jgi:FkbM family methyltransferase
MKNFRRFFKNLRRKYFPNDFDKEITRWFRDEGDYFYRLEYNLNQNSIVIDLGGYKGQFASDIHSKYLCKVLVFEPIKSYFELIQDRFKKNSYIDAFNFALGEKDKADFFYMDNDGTSINNRSRIGNSQKQEVIFRDIETFFKEKNITSVDLIKINIEGGEYELLEYILDKDLAKVFKNIQVQFHKYIINSDEKMLSIQKKLEKTHVINWQYRFVWENWVKK